MKSIYCLLAMAAGTVALSTQLAPVVSAQDEAPSKAERRAEGQLAAAPENREANICVNAYPARIQAKLEAVDREMIRAGGSQLDGQPLWLVAQINKTWQVDSTVTVAFHGGTKELHHQVAEAMADWADYGDVKLDFGRNASTGEYRSWSPSDTSFKSNIRVSFDHPEGGYWSLVGSDSSNAQIVSPGEASLNLQGFSGNLTDDQKGTALHEMGHALGFQHEHQSPRGGCDHEFRWEDDPATGAPGIYSVLGGPPNYWPRWKVDHNLRQLPNSRLLLVTRYDPASIMHYSFPSWMFVSGQRSPCHTGRNNQLSDGDKAGMAMAYPKASGEQKKKRQLRLEAFGELMKGPGLKEETKKEIRSQLESKP